MTARSTLRQPFIGLRPYRREERDLFYGRGRDARLLTAKIFSARLTLLYGRSGLGKSSLLNALVIPQLEAEDATVLVFDRWAGGDTLQALKGDVRGLARAVGLDGAAEDATLADLVRVITHAGPRTLVLILDQFEEIIVRYPGTLDRLTGELAELLRSGGPDLHLVISLREEWLAALQPLRRQVVNLFRSTFRLEPLPEEGAREAVREPPRECAGSIEKALEDRLLKDLTSLGNRRASDPAVDLPCLQLVCRQLWRESPDRHLSVSRYEALGGRDGILDRYVRDTMPPKGPDVATARLLRFLAPDSGHKQAFAARELATYTGLREDLVRRELERLAKARVLRLRRQVSGPSLFELAHDAYTGIIGPWRDEVLERAAAEEGRELRRRKHRRTAAAGVLLLLAVAALWMWTLKTAKKAEYRANTIGMVEPLRELDDTTRALQAAPSLERVANYLIYQRRDADRFTRLKEILEKYEGLLHPTYPLEAPEQVSLGGREERSPVVIEYPPTRARSLSPADQRTWRVGFRQGWFKAAKSLAENWGIPIPDVVHLKPLDYLPEDRLKVRIHDGAAFWVHTPFRDDRPLLTADSLTGPGREFFDAFRGEWPATDLGLGHETAVRTVSSWSRPAWAVVAGADLTPPGGRAARAVVAHLLAHPEHLIRDEVLENMFLPMRRKHSATIREAQATRQDRLGADLQELVRRGVHLRANNLVMLLDGLAHLRDEDSKRAAEAAESFAHGSVELSGPLSGTRPETDATSPPNPNDDREPSDETRVRSSEISVYERTRRLLPRTGAVIRLELGGGAAHLESELARAWSAHVKTFRRQFGIELPPWSMTLAEPSQMPGRTARFEVLNQHPAHADAQPFALPREAPVDRVAKGLQLRTYVLRTRLITADHVANRLPPALLSWLLNTHYSLTDLVRIQRAVIAPTNDEIKRTPTAREGDDLNPPAHHTLRHVEWLFASLAFWSHVADPLDLEAVQANLRHTQGARQRPHAYRSPSGEAQNRVKWGVAAIHDGSFARAARHFRTAVDTDRDAAVAAFLDLYPKKFIKRRLDSLRAHCQASRARFGRLDAAHRFDLAEVIETAAPGRPDLRALRLCLAVARAENDEAHLHSILERYPDLEGWSPPEALWLAWAILDRDPARPEQTWRNAGLELAARGVERSADPPQIAHFFERMRARCVAGGPKNWCWQLLRRIVETKPTVGLLSSLGSDLSSRPSEDDLRRAIQLLQRASRRLPGLEADRSPQRDGIDLALYRAQIALALGGYDEMHAPAEAGMHRLLEGKRPLVSLEAVRWLSYIRIDRRQFAEADQLIETKFRELIPEDGDPTPEQRSLVSRWSEIAFRALIRAGRLDEIGPDAKQPAGRDEHGPGPGSLLDGRASQSDPLRLRGGRDRSPQIDRHGARATGLRRHDAVRGPAGVGPATRLSAPREAMGRDRPRAGDVVGETARG